MFKILTLCTCTEPYPHANKSIKWAYLMFEGKLKLVSKAGGRHWWETRNQLCLRLEYKDPSIYPLHSISTCIFLLWRSGRWSEQVVIKGNHHFAQSFLELKTPASSAISFLIFSAKLGRAFDVFSEKLSGRPQKEHHVTSRRSSVCLFDFSRPREGVETGQSLSQNRSSYAIHQALQWNPA